MSYEPVKVKDEHDAILWLNFFARFAGPDLAEPCKSIRNVFFDVIDQRQEARDRCAALAKTIEVMQAHKEQPRPES